MSRCDHLSTQIADTAIRWAYFAPPFVDRWLIHLADYLRWRAM